MPGYYDDLGQWIETSPGYQPGGGGTGTEPTQIDPPPPQYQIPLDQMYQGYGMGQSAPEAPQWLPPPPVEAQPIPQGQPPPQMMRQQPPEPGEGYAKFTGQGWVPQDAPGAPQPPPQNEQQARQGNTFKMEFMNPYTGKGGFLDVPNNKEGEQLYNDYVRRGYQVRFPKHEQQQQAQQPGMGQPPVNPQEMLAQVQLQPHEQKEYQRLQGLMTTVAKQMAEGRDMGAGSKAMLALKRAIEPYEKRQQMTKQLAVKTQAEEVKQKAQIDVEARVEAIAKFNKMLKENPDLIQRTDNGDGTFTIITPTPDGKFHTQTTKPPQELAKEKLELDRQKLEMQAAAQKEAMDFRKQQAEERKAAREAFDKASDEAEKHYHAIYDENHKRFERMTPADEKGKKVEFPTAQFEEHLKANGIGRNWQEHKAMLEATGRLRPPVAPQQQGQQQPNPKAQWEAFKAQFGSMDKVPSEMRQQAEALWRAAQGGQ